MALTVGQVMRILRRDGYKATPQRRAVVRAIARSRDHVSPAAIHERVQHEHRGVSLVTVYRTLEVLSSLGLLCRVHAGDAGESCGSYLMRRPSGHHHHLVCSYCGRVVDFAGCDLSELEQEIAKQTGFVVEGHLLQLQGRCPGCAKRDASRTGGQTQT